MIPIIREEINPKQALLHPNSLATLQFLSKIHNTTNHYNFLCVSLNNSSQKLYLSCVLNDELEENVIALPRWLSLTFKKVLNSGESLENVNVHPIDISKDLTIVKKIFLIKIYGDVWIPSSKSLYSSYIQSSQRAKSYNPDWHELILSHFDGQVVSKNSLLSDVIMDHICVFRVVSLQLSYNDDSALNVQDSSLIAKIDQHETKVDITSSFVPRQLTPIVGFTDESDSLYQIISDSFLNTEIHTRLGIPETKTLLIIGSHGSGRKSLIQHVCNKLSATLFMISLTTMIIKHDMFENIDEYEENPLRIMFTKAMLSIPSVIVIKDLDALAVNEQGYSIGEWRTKVINMLVREIRDIHKAEQVFVIGLTCDKTKLPRELCKIEIFQQDFVLSIPSRKQRELILSFYLSKLKLSYSCNQMINNYITKLGLMTSGYVPRDLKELCRLAVLRSLNNVNKNASDVDLVEDLARLTINESVSSNDGGKGDHASLSVIISWNDFEYAMSIIFPSQKIEFESILPQRRWDDIGGYEGIKKKIKQIVEWPIIKHDAYKRLGVEPPSGILLYGCGKTIMVQALATESYMNVICINGPKIYSKYLGETENAIRNLFKRARQIIPCIVFIDELDSIASRREFSSDGTNRINERVLSTLLNEMDGRFDQLIYIGLPNEFERFDILQVISKKVSFGDNVNLNELSKNTKMYSGADLEILIRESGLCSLREDILSTKINNKHIESTLKKMNETKTLDDNQLIIYENFCKSK
ncbi:16009_t:CDS:10 [Funneliformis geosporum]|uniref:3055_t:CDS:1 n=1 Tax=Funneliformis geosporum TaxID=1117311 RepID=A0A9W4WJ67_9GLOM|nr:16009_t:CDS:10 [Funneliformis geosporum]CAI2165807.1 3055_t:CDS:10 [Funneliformis geosporum]